MAVASIARPRVRVRISDRPDPWIFLITGLLVLCGVLFVLDTTYFYASHRYNDGLRLIVRHGASIFIGGLLLILCSRLRSDWLERSAGYLFAASIALLALTLVPGVRLCANGACRWIPMPLLGQFQPAEFTKIAFVIVAAAWFARHGDKIQKLRYGMLPTLAALGLVGGMLLAQPDFGTAALIGAVGMMMLFLAGVPIWQVGMLGAGMIAAGVALVLDEPYRVERVTDWLAQLLTGEPSDPQGSGWQLVQAMIAFGSGQLWGQGLGASTQKAGWLPEAHTDFIFSVIGEETGLAGALLLLICFGALAYRGYRVAHRHPDMYGQLVAAGLTLTLALQAMINMGVVLGLLPTKGIGLPFVSYGGTSMILFLAAAGLLMSLSRELRER